MANLIVGDIHGCFDELMLLLKKADFNPSQDTLWSVGDLVARGKKSLDVLRYFKSLGKHGKIVLGNHDLHLLAIYAGISHCKNKDNLEPLLQAPDCDDLINWLRKQPLLLVNHNLKFVVSHAGITPQWDLATAEKCAKEVSDILKSSSYPLFLDSMYGDLPNYWAETLQGLPRLRFSTNVLTRMRFCYPNGQLDMICKESPEDAPAPLQPWFSLPSKITEQGYSIIFGHWAALKGKQSQPNIYPIDTGCCWNGKLTLLRFEDLTFFKQKKL